MPKEQFLYAETKPVFDLIEETSRRSGVSRAQAFEDFLHMSVCALSGGQMEEQYLATVKKHEDGKPRKRGCDSISHAFGTLVNVMEETRKNILGDLFQGGITYGEAGQFLSPEPICQMTASMTVGDVSKEEGSARKSVCDPCCGSGRMLLAVADVKPHWEFVGQDVDLRCVRMTALNLALRNLYGYVVWGNSLGFEAARLSHGLQSPGLHSRDPVGELSRSGPASRERGGRSTSRWLQRTTGFDHQKRRQQTTSARQATPIVLAAFAAPRSRVARLHHSADVRQSVRLSERFIGTVGTWEVVCSSDKRMVAAGVAPASSKSSTRTTRR